MKTVAFALALIASGSLSAQCPECVNHWGSTTASLTSVCGTFTVTIVGGRPGTCDTFPACLPNEVCRFSYDAVFAPTGLPGCAVWFQTEACLPAPNCVKGPVTPLPGALNQQVRDYSLACGQRVTAVFEWAWGPNSGLQGIIENDCRDCVVR